MQEPRTTTTGDVTPARRFLSPLQGFLVVVALVGLGLGIWWIQARGSEPEDGPSSAAPSPSPPQDVVSAFRELHTNLLSAYRHRDETLLKAVFVPGSEAWTKAAGEIRQLRRDDVVDKSRYRIVALSGTEKGDSGVVTETRLLTTRFVTESGTDVSTASSTLRQKVQWRLALVEGAWLIEDSTIVESEVVDQ